MIHFFSGHLGPVFAVQSDHKLTDKDFTKLKWLLADVESVAEEWDGYHVGPRREMITPWSTNAVEITLNMGIRNIQRIERFIPAESDYSFDPMLEALYQGLDQTIFDIDQLPQEVIYISDIAAYNQKEGLALSEEEIDYLQNVSRTLNRQLTDSEIFGFSQVNSEHCRHKIFNGRFIINGEEKQKTLFQLIKDTSASNPNHLVSAYKDNVAFVKGPIIQQFAPKRQDVPDYFQLTEISSAISIKAETHNFPTTVEPFNGASTGTGGEIRDRMAGGQGSMPLAGTAVYMTPYSRTGSGNKAWEERIPERNWLYQNPLDLLIKASNGASDFGNKFGQPLICGSVLTFEYQQDASLVSYDKVIMLAGGVGYAHLDHTQKEHPRTGDHIVVLGGDNYRIGMGGSSVSSVATGEYTSGIELNAVQRANPEMQKRVANTIRALAEQDINPVVSIHDHGAGGHLNCLSELVEETGGVIDLWKLPIGDPTLSAREIIGNESQERMGLVMSEEHIDQLKRIAERERAPCYLVGTITGDNHFTFQSRQGPNPMDWDLKHLFGSSPQTVMLDKHLATEFEEIQYSPDRFEEYLSQVLQLEAVGCKDWLTNKVDRSVTGKVMLQQTAGSIQLPLNNLGLVALDYQGTNGVATSLGHAPGIALINAAAGSRMAVAKALTNLLWTPIESGLRGISLSANWMWPVKNPGEAARLYQAVEALSEFAIALGINVPTGKDSLSMVQKYPEGPQVSAPGTVIVSTVATAHTPAKTIQPVLKEIEGSTMVYIPFTEEPFSLGGSSLAQVLGKMGNTTPDIQHPGYFKTAFEALQELVTGELLLAGHDISAGGLITTLLEMTFTHNEWGLDLDLTALSKDMVPSLFSENPGVVVQTSKLPQVESVLQSAGLKFYKIGHVVRDFTLQLQAERPYRLDLREWRQIWYSTSFELDQHQCRDSFAEYRFKHYWQQPLQYHIPREIKELEVIRDTQSDRGRPKAAIIREKGVNGDREMAFALYHAGFEVKDVHMTDLISGREDLREIQFMVFVGGFSNSDVLGSAKGWAGAFLYNAKARKALDNFYQRKDTLSLGVCNGCQLMMELGVVYPEYSAHPYMTHNDSGKFESSFLNVTIPPNRSVMLESLAGSRLGIWVAHGEGKFNLDGPKENYHIAAYYSYGDYPGNPNGSHYNVAAMASHDGRHLVMMPHLERSIFPWQWAYQDGLPEKAVVTPWMQAFVNAREWVLKTRELHSH